MQREAGSELAVFGDGGKLNWKSAVKSEVEELSRVTLVDAFKRSGKYKVCKYCLFFTILVCGMTFW